MAAGEERQSERPTQVRDESQLGHARPPSSPRAIRAGCKKTATSAPGDAGAETMLTARGKILTPSFDPGPDGSRRGDPAPPAPLPQLVPPQELSRINAKAQERRKGAKN